MKCNTEMMYRKKNLENCKILLAKSVVIWFNCAALSIAAVAQW